MGFVAVPFREQQQTGAGADGPCFTLARVVGNRPHALVFNRPQRDETESPALSQ